MSDDDLFALLTLNPGYETAPRNPLCPVCHEQIRPISNDVERRFVCGCEQVWQFTFDRQVDIEHAAADGTTADVDYELVKGADSHKWHWFKPEDTECFCGNVKEFAIDSRVPPGTSNRRDVSETCLEAFRQTTAVGKERNG